MRPLDGNALGLTQRHQPVGGEGAGTTAASCCHHPHLRPSLPVLMAPGPDPGAGAVNHCAQSVRVSRTILRKRSPTALWSRPVGLCFTENLERAWGTQARLRLPHPSVWVRAWEGQLRSAAPVPVTIRAARIPEKVALSPGAGRPRWSGGKGVWPKADVWKRVPLHLAQGLPPGKGQYGQHQPSRALSSHDLPS